MGEDRVAVLLLYHTVFVICMYKHHTILVNSTHAESQTCMKDDNFQEGFDKHPHCWTRPEQRPLKAFRSTTNSS